MPVHGDTSTEPDTDDAAEGDVALAGSVRAHATTPDRAVFTEAGNCDGWIASDHLVDVER